MKSLKKVLAVVLALAIIAMPAMNAKAAVSYTTDEVMGYFATDATHNVVSFDESSASWQNYAWIKFNAEADTIQLELDVLEKIATIDYVFTGDGSFNANFVKNTAAAGGWDQSDSDTIAVTPGNDYVHTIADANGANAAAEAEGNRYFNFCIQTTSTPTGTVDVKEILMKDADGNVVIEITNPAYAAADEVPATGDMAPVALAAVVAACALCGIVVINRKKAYR